MSDNRQQYEVIGMHCESCVTRIQQALTTTSGVAEASVTLEPPRATVLVKEGVDLSGLRKSVRAVGKYDLEPIEVSVGQETTRSIEDADTGEPRESLYPLLLILGFVAGVTGLVAVRTGTFGAKAVMANFMAGFFIVFGFFKLLDIRGFVTTYRRYDLVAKAVPAWAWVYPFLELLLGTAYILAFAPVSTNLVTLVVMLTGATGVGKALFDKQRIHCACLGTVLNLPMTTVSLVEDLGMAAMAAAMLLGRS